MTQGRTQDSVDGEYCDWLDTLIQHIHGDDTGRKTLSTLYIANLGDGTPELGNYFVSIKDHDTGLVTHTTEIRGFQRHKGATELVRQALNALPQHH